MKNKTRKILDFLFQDVHFKHNYFLVGGILLFLTLVGATSYALFSYEVYSPGSIHIAYEDVSVPICVIEGPAKTTLFAYDTTTYTMNCTAKAGMKDKTLTSSNFTITGDISISSISKETIQNGYKYTISISSAETNGFANIQLKSNVIQDAYGKYNDASNMSESVVINAEKVICDAMPEETSSANAPSLASNMIPVCYNSAKDVWLKADSTNVNVDYQWYSYSGKQWANAVTVTEANRNTYINADAGTPISMDDINTMWVWIPRFSATGDTANYNGGTASAPGAFNITFVNKDTVAHDAFTFGEEISGFWMGKFENSSDETCKHANYSAVGAGCNLTSIRPKIIPNVTSWRGAMVSTFFYDILNMTESGNQYGFDKTVDTTIDTHMLKNNEWGAVAYLAQSIYGRCTSLISCSEVGINNNSSYVTGYGALAGSSESATNGTYETTLGMDASTTGNIYGVYDMSGGSFENVMGVYTDGTKLWSGYRTSSNEQHSGFNGWLDYDNTNYEDGVAYPSDSKYYNLYTTSTDYTSGGLQHAMTETSRWYSDGTSFVDSYSPWVIRGADYYSSSDAGVFRYGLSYGNAYFHSGSRSSIIIN